MKTKTEFPPMLYVVRQVDGKDVTYVASDFHELFGHGEIVAKYTLQSTYVKHIKHELRGRGES